MNSPRTFFLLLLALLVSCFGLAAHLQPQFQGWRGSRATGDIFNVVLGDSRRLFANQFYVKADAYYHSGYYPSMFDDNAAFQTTHMAADTGAVNSKNHGDEDGFSPTGTLIWTAAARRIIWATATRSAKFCRGSSFPPTSIQTTCRPTPSPPSGCANG